jgi:hypothetical protein
MTEPLDRSPRLKHVSPLRPPELIQIPTTRQGYTAPASSRRFIACCRRHHFPLRIPAENASMINRLANGRRAVI